jgi:hemerythrin-like domain-containing protein
VALEHAKETTMKATDILRSEHETILDVLAALESISRPAVPEERLDLRSAQEALDFLRGFADRCHHGKEEQLFFPALAARGLTRRVGPLAVMASEHEKGRTLLARMADGLAEAKQSKPGAAARFRSAATTYVALMRAHINKENGILFPLGDGMLSEAEQIALLVGFEHFEHDGMGSGAHERFLDIASGLCERLGLDQAQASMAGHRCCGHETPCS